MHLMKNENAQGKNRLKTFFILNKRNLDNNDVKRREKERQLQK